MTVKILVGDSRELLKSLPANSVHCVVTSPPYFGLRDYGTGQWVGGDPNCKHSVRAVKVKPLNASLARATMAGSDTTNAA